MELETTFAPERRIPASSPTASRGRVSPIDVYTTQSGRSASSVSASDVAQYSGVDSEPCQVAGVPSDPRLAVRVNAHEVEVLASHERP